MRLKKSRYLALEDAIFDSRIPLRSEEEFRVGITFVAKLVGCGNVPRPNTRMEIVASMRRIRSDCRLRKDKKRKTILTVSYEGVKVALPSGKKSSANLIITQHPIHRIFYVSHDSLDLHIFSYIAREGSTFKCFVFKAAKQSLAVNIVRTIGQAFELCHKMTFIMNECTNGDTTTTTTINNNSLITAANSNIITTDMTTNDHSSPRSNLTIDETKTNVSDRPTPSQTLRKDLNLNMEQMIHDVNYKLDKLSYKIEILEKQISILLSSMTLNQERQQINNQSNMNRSSDNNNNLNKVTNRLNESPKSSEQTFNNDNEILDRTSPENDLITVVNHHDEKQKQLNSPDSLLSSPMNHTDNILASCLLFKDFY